MARLYAIISSAADIAAQFEVAAAYDIIVLPELVEGM